MPGSKGGGQDLGAVEALGPRPPQASSGEARACRVGRPFSEAEEEAVCDSQRTSPSQLSQGPLACSRCEGGGPKSAPGTSGFIHSRKQNLNIGLEAAPSGLQTSM